MTSPGESEHSEPNEAHEQSDAAHFYMNQFEMLDDVPELQALVKLRAEEMRGQKIWNGKADPNIPRAFPANEKGARVIIEEALKELQTSILEAKSEPFKASGLPTVAEFKVDDPFDQAVAQELINLLGATEESFEEGMPQKGRYAAYIPSTAPTKLPSFQLVRSQFLFAPPNQPELNHERIKYYLEPAVQG